MIVVRRLSDITKRIGPPEFSSIGGEKSITFCFVVETKVSLYMNNNEKQSAKQRLLKHLNKKRIQHCSEIK